MAEWTAAPNFREVFEHNGSVMLLVDPVGGKIVDANPAAVAYYGYPAEQLVGTSLAEINALDWEETANERKNALFPERNYFSFRHRLFSGELRDVEVFVSPVHVGGKQLVFSVVHDVTALKQAREELHVSEAIYRSVFQTSRDVIAISRVSDGMFVDVNEAYLKNLGFEREEVIGRTSLELDIWVSPEERDAYVENSAQGSDNGTRVRFRRKDGTIFWAVASMSKVDIDGEPHIVSVVKNVTDVKEAEEKIQNLVFYDTLTQLPNRRLFLDRLNHGLENPSKRNKRALLIIDLDKFRELKDTYGHDGGELMLQEVARRLAACTGEADTVARLGGDEFGVLLESLSGSRNKVATQAQAEAEKIQAALTEPYLLKGREYHGVCSMGIYLLRNEPQSAEQVMQNAQVALSYAKPLGGKKISFFSPELQAVVDAHAAIKEELRLAIKSDQLALYYQPQVSAGALVGAESLVRWRHPTRGILTPNHFVPLAEESGLIRPLGKWVLEAAFSQIARWTQQPASEEIRFSVNITAKEFQHPDFVDEVLAAVNRSGANPKNIKLELTESMLVGNFDEVVAKMTQLKSHGFRFSIDDFGTGYSSLSYMKYLPVDELKIDRSFVNDIATDSSSSAIAETIMSLGRVMGLSVIAEGVETEEQRDYLARLGCISYQGYLFGKPVPAEEFEQLWLSRQQAS
jgi:diguanylate cyclase (GGDEF)-like protein/PAS domain S-box-containing protein